MDAVARNSSEDVLRTIDRLLVEGQSAQHFARQMLRFLRNALVAKVAGSDSQVLQISTDERARVARVAERFSEEDLSRFMQIMLRTHSELGYKQEQRFHLELGLLKLVHAQRLLPLEELLSGEVSQTKTVSSGLPAAKPAGGSLRAASAAPARANVTSRSASESEPTSSRAPAASPFTRPSPFEADRNRKGEPKAEAQPSFAASNVSSIATASSGTPIVANASSVESETVTQTQHGYGRSCCTRSGCGGSRRRRFLQSRQETRSWRRWKMPGQQVLAHNLEEGEWLVAGTEVSVKVAMSQVLIDVALGPEPKRIIQAR